MTAAAPPPPRNLLILGALIALGLGLRLWYWASIRDTHLFTIPYLDCRDYHDWARALAAGDWGRGEPYWLGPLYPHLLALGYAIFGPESSASMLAQWGLTLLNVGLVYRLGRRWLDESGALLGAALYAGYGPPVFYAGLRLMETVVTTLLLLIALQSWRAASAPTGRRWLVLGLLVGLCATARGSALALLPLLPLALLPVRRRGLRLAALLWLGAALAILPVTVRNLVVGGDLVLLSSNFGLNLLIGQQAQHGGRFGPVSEHLEYEFDPTGELLLFDELGRDLPPSQVSRELARRAVARALRDPAATLRNHALKAYRFWSGYEQPQIFSWNHWRAEILPLGLLPVPALALTALGLAGTLALGAAARRQWLVLVGGWFLGFLPFFPTARFRLPVMPLLALSAAAWLLAVVRAWRAGRRRRAALLLAVGIGLAAALWPAWGALPPAEEAWHGHLNRASLAAEAGDRAAVVAAFADAERARPGLAETPYRRGGLLDELGDTSGALAAYEEAARRAPQDPFVLHRRARALADLGRPDEAIEGFAAAIAADPGRAHPWHGRGLALRALGRLEDAVPDLARAAALAPGRPRFRSNQASLLAELGRLDEAAAILGRLTDDFPGYLPGWFNLALVEMNRGEIEASRRALAGAAALRGLSARERTQIEELAGRLRDD